MIVIMMFVQLISVEIEIPIQIFSRCVDNFFNFRQTIHDYFREIS